MSKGNPAKLKKVSVSLPFGLGSAEWEADSTQRRAAWALYVAMTKNYCQIRSLISR
ncbi:MAG: hypothetical protein LH660_20925 [Phormidesmis sp. CAN_BIN36]|nr:hypothetical protein [Phormidesmis sp. CAN_BIN36]